MVTQTLAPSSADDPLAYRPVALVDLLDRVLATGVVISGEITIAIADIDLVYVSLRALISSVGSLTPPEPPDALPPAAAPDGVAALPTGVAPDGMTS
ncbi:gas vesicle protein [Micromonospora sp. NPDC050686]|uniref:gas vesicle protein n=1 Tax=Micromonospora sp. NPDC050686 TaxID=3154631 RepID=UPI0033EDD320